MDVESVVLHELGHFVGLGHSAIGETEPLATGGRRVLGSGAVMFPIAFTPGATADRVLQDDDKAGVRISTRRMPQNRTSGSVTGRVTKNGRGVYGAHVLAFQRRTGRMVGGFSLNANGDFVIAGLEPGPHIVRVEPLDDADVESFLSGDVDVDFRAAYAPRMAVAPVGGTSGTIEIQVVPEVSRRRRLRLFSRGQPDAGALGAGERVRAGRRASPSVRAHHVTVSGGLVWTSGYSSAMPPRRCAATPSDLPRRRSRCFARSRRWMAARVWTRASGLRSRGR